MAQKLLEKQGRIDDQHHESVAHAAEKHSEDLVKTWDWWLKHRWEMWRRTDKNTQAQWLKCSLETLQRVCKNIWDWSLKHCWKTENCLRGVCIFGETGFWSHWHFADGGLS